MAWAAQVTRRKLGMKLLQRVAMVHLPPRVAAWRYQRGSRSLEQNLQLQAAGAAAGVGGAAEKEAVKEAAEEAGGEEEAEEGEEEEGEEDEVPEAIEEIIEQMLRGLRDADTVVRWSAAKGIGRVTARLPLELADDIVESVLELLSEQEDASAWHGGCLALAELSRRGLLLPARLAEVMPRVVTALHYDVPRGATSIGTHVRDAACYVSWAFARAFEPAVMAPHVQALAQALLVVVVFDREVNCRRAASAAFQENVGRQGTFPHGIDIVTRADYYSVGSRPNAFLRIGAYLGGFDTYRTPMLKHLSTVKFKHWDNTIRLLSAQAAARLAPLDPTYTWETMMPWLYGKSLSADLKARHGATHMIAECVLSLVRVLHGGAGRALPPETRKAISGVVPAIEKARLYRGRGGEIMRGAACRLVEVQALVALPCGPKTALKTLASLDDSLKHPTEPISHAAVAAIRAVGAAYFAASPTPDVPFERLVVRYAKPLGSDPNAALRRGYTLALGALPRVQLRAALPEATRALMTATRMEENVELRDPETRRNAVRALLQVASTVGLAAVASVEGALADAGSATTVEGTAAQEGAPAGASATDAPAAPPAVALASGMSTALYVEAVDAMLAALGDYQTDNRGDVGSWVRESAITALLPMLLLAAPPAPSSAAAGAPAGAPAGAATTDEVAAERAALSVALPGLCTRFVEALTRLANEKIDKMREHAALTLAKVVSHAELPAVAHRAQLMALLPVHVAAADDAADISADGAADGALDGAVDGAADGTTATPLDGTAEGAAEALYVTSEYLAPHSCFPITVRLLELGAFRRAALHGLAISVGGITESTTKAAAAALTTHMRALTAAGCATISADLVALMREHANTPRVFLPLMRTTQQLLEMRLLEPALSDDGNGLAAQLIECIKPASRSKDMPTLTVALSLLILLLPHASGVARTDVFRTLLLLLGHRFPKLRKAAADQVYVYFLTYGDPGELAPLPDVTTPRQAAPEASATLGAGTDGTDGAAAPAADSPALDVPATEPPMEAGEARLEFMTSVLLETAWLEALEAHAKPARAKLLAALGLPPPKVVQTAVKVAKVEENTYKELVGEMGY